VPASRPIALSAPGLTGPISIINEPVSGPRSSRRARNRPYSHAHLEIDLSPDLAIEGDAPHLQRLERALSEKKIAETPDLVLLAVGTLHALSARHFRQVDHWEVSPGGWLPLPSGKARRGSEEPVSDLLAVVESDAWSPLTEARTFSARLSDQQGHRVDVVVRRIHRPRHHVLSLDLRGVWTQETIHDLVGSLSARLPVAQSTLTKFQYA
jgi:hypothetical protein